MVWHRDMHNNRSFAPGAIATKVWNPSFSCAQAVVTQHSTHLAASSALGSAVERASRWILGVCAASLPFQGAAVSARIPCAHPQRASPNANAVPSACRFVSLLCRLTSWTCPTYGLRASILKDIHSSISASLALAPAITSARPVCVPILLTRCAQARRQAASQRR